VRIRLVGERLARWAGATARKIAATTATVAAWGSVVVLGSHSTFPGSDLTIVGGGGDVSLGLGGPTARVGVPLEFSGLVPGGAVTQAVALVNDGDADLATVTLVTDALESSPLDTDRVNGLQLSVAACSVPWTSEWTCPGEQALLLGPGPVMRRAQLREPASRVAGATDHLAVTVALPGTAGSELSGLHSELVLTFTGVQAADNR
jgi:spore coat-associated protein N